MLFRKGFYRQALNFQRFPVMFFRVPPQMVRQPPRPSFGRLWSDCPNPTACLAGSPEKHDIFGTWTLIGEIQSW